MLFKNSENKYYSVLASSHGVVIKAYKKQKKLKMSDPDGLARMLTYI